MLFFTVQPVFADEKAADPGFEETLGEYDPEASSPFRRRLTPEVRHGSRRRAAAGARARRADSAVEWNPGEGGRADAQARPRAACARIAARIATGAAY